MIQIQKSFIEEVEKAGGLTDLYLPLQYAIELEHATIPPYLTAMFSLMPGKNNYIRQSLHDIVTEEMLHMTIASNILNALGGSPLFNSPKFIPVYPGPLPMAIGTNLIVGLEKYSVDLVKRIFMSIEQPEKELHIPKFSLRKYATIGEYYAFIKKKIKALAPDILPGDPAKQVTSQFYAKDLLFPIISKQDAVNAINIIVEQGEGTTVQPAGPHGELAHFYKFEELYVGFKIVHDSTSPVQYSFSKERVPFNEKNVFNIFPNTKSQMLESGSEERLLLDQFNASYSRLLNGLQKTFNGEPQCLDNSIGLMYNLKLAAQKLCATAFPGKEGYTIGPSFEFLPVY